MIREETNEISPEFQILILVLAIVVILTIQWILKLIISKPLRKTEKIPLDVINGLKVMVNLGAAAVVLYIVMFLFQLSIEEIIGVSAFLGAIISFGSTQTLSNFIAGLYLIFVNPFGVNDFVALGTEIQGQVVEISLNYTKIRTINDIYHYIPNQNFLTSNTIIYKQQMERRIGSREALDLQSQKSRIRSLKTFALELIEEEVVRYAFVWGAPLGDLKTAKARIQEVCDIYAGVFGYKPEFFLYTLDYRMQFKFVITTHNSELLLQNLREFRDEIVARFH
ncbi:MAG: mechanosensitive ion channel [Candidatus Heimdallarchaeota archaeon]|nr:MAG: mechanosensitive ion channel [Candidatus Heimdallarchaeota archaeon]